MKRYWPLAAIGLAVVLSGWLTPPKVAERPMTVAPVHAALTDHTMKATHFGCLTPEEYQETAGLLGDDAAFKTRLTQRLILRQCTIFEEGARVVVVDVGIWSGMIRIRKPGRPDAFWLAIRYVD